MDKYSTGSIRLAFKRTARVPLKLFSTVIIDALLINYHGWSPAINGPITLIITRTHYGALNALPASDQIRRRVASRLNYGSGNCLPSIGWKRICLPCLYDFDWSNVPINIYVSDWHTCHLVSAHLSSSVGNKKYKITQTLIKVN